MASQLNPLCRVLYIEDTKEDQQILQEAIKFTDVPLELLTATTANDGLHLLSNEAPFHVLVVDWNLPAVSGAEFLTSVRAAQPTVPIIILTGEPRLVDAAAAATLGASTILKKPLLLDEWEQLAYELYALCGKHFTKLVACTN